MNDRTVAVPGASGAIGEALCLHLALQYPQAVLNGFSRQVQPSLTALGNIQQHSMDDEDESSIAHVAFLFAAHVPLDLVSWR